MNDFLNRVSTKTGYLREKYSDKKVPENFQDIDVCLFFGDMRGQFLLSSFLLTDIKSKYLILCSYPGKSGIFDVDEYWAIKDEGLIKNFIDNAVGVDNLAKNKILFQEQQLNKYFENLINVNFNGFNKDVLCKLPSIPSSKIEFNRELSKRDGYKVLVYPSRVIRAWSKGKQVVVKSRIEFWHELIELMLARGFQPVVYMDYGTFDVSRYFESKCIYCVEKKILDVLGVLRTVGCVLDVFDGFSRYGNLARVPFIACVERNLYNKCREWEVDSLLSLPHKYIFSFPTMIENGSWNELVLNIVNRLEMFIPNLNREEWPDTAEQSLVLPYSSIKSVKSKRIGARFIKVLK